MKIKGMHDSAKNAAIAKFCGYEPQLLWRYYLDKERQHGTIMIVSKEEAEQAKARDIKWAEELGYAEHYQYSEVEQYEEWDNVAPRYTYSLDAIHKAEECLSADQWSDYARLVEESSRKLPNTNLNKIWRELNPSRVVDACLINCSAKIKADCFLEAIGYER